MFESDSGAGGVPAQLWAWAVASEPVLFIASVVFFLASLFVLHRAATALERSRSEHALASRALFEVTKLLSAHAPGEANKLGASPPRVNLAGPVQKSVRPVRVMSAPKPTVRPTERAAAPRRLFQGQS